MIKDLFSLVSSFKGSDSVAYYNENTVYSFDDLYRWSVSISDALREQGLKQGDKVVVLADKSPKSMAVFFACLISGLVFCPVDRRAPRARLMDILNRLEARLIVGDEISFSSIDQNFWSDLEGELIQLSLENIELSENAGPIELIEDYEDLLAYIIFTSGSTGRPKGVKISHENLLAFLNAFPPHYGQEDQFKYMSLGPLFFDMTLLDTLIPVISGSSTYLIQPPYLPNALWAAIQEYEINCFSVVPSTLKFLMDNWGNKDFDSINSLKLLLVGAESPDIEGMNALLKNIPDLHIVNAYGPTECSVCCFSKLFNEEIDSSVKRMSSGQCFEGVKYLLESANGDMTTEGEGILYIGGKQVMIGYLGEESDENSNIFNINGERYYKTGDLVSVEPNNEIVFLGRADDEVKLNGYRINLKEISLALESHDDIRVAFAASLKGHQTDEIVCAYSSDSPISNSIITKYLKSKLPSYMMPKKLTWVDNFPMMTNGKLDRRAIINKLNSL